MPTRGKRTLGEFDPNKSDSEDETYGVSSSKPVKSRPSKSRVSRPSRKRQKRGYDGDDSSDDQVISESDLSVIEDDEEEDEEEAPEMGASGRPKRKAAKNTKPIIEDEDSVGSDDEEEPVTAKREAIPSRRSERQSQWVKINYKPGNSPIPVSNQPRRRSARARSASVPTSRPTSSGLQTAATRRGSRRAHGNSELVALRKGIQSPTGAAKRPTRGGKGPKKEVISSTADDEEIEDNPKYQQSTDELQRDHFPKEIAESREDLAEEPEDVDMPGAEQTEATAGSEVIMEDASEKSNAVIPESEVENAGGDDDEDPISQPRRNTRQRDPRASAAAQAASAKESSRTVLGKRKTRGSQRSGNQESSDFEPPAEEVEEEDVSDSEESASPRKNSQYDEDESSGRRVSKRRKNNTRPVSNESDEQEELMEELDGLRTKRSKRSKISNIIMEDRYKSRRRRDHKVNYNIMASNAALARAIEEGEEEGPAQSTPSKRARGHGTYNRSLFSTYGPFGGAGGAPPVLGGPTGLGAVGGADSDSSDDEIMQRPKPVATGLGGAMGMTPTTAHPAGFGLFPSVTGQVHGADPAQATAGTPANLGRVKDKQALADADPLGVDPNVNFDGVGGLQSHIDQLKEMVALPLLYPEVFHRFHVTPPRGVLFHGPPGTGKTLLARALASSVSSQGKKVTFYMRKGADALSKWVGEAERQLRLLFDEARKNQPSIIFFDEIDGLAPVRSSKQEQIHASIVSTLLALMDGMDGRGQVIVIGATNRPDSVDPALRRPGRFDREFYFPLPNTEARRAILDIHTKGWDPPLDSSFKNDIAKATKGYGGADLRALCTEAALNAVQRTYPQIYKATEKLLIKPETIKVRAKDFMISVRKMVPSSERTASSGASPLPSQIEPLLREALEAVKALAANILPQAKPLTALQEAEFEDAEDDRGMRAEQMQQEFERSRIFRPRLLIKSIPGMGQQYLASALLNHFEGLHIQAFDLPTLLSDSTRSSEAAIVQLFTEVRRHKPSVIYIPNVDVWYETVGQAVISTFTGLLRTLSPTDPVLLLGVLEGGHESLDHQQKMKDLFGYSKKSQFIIRYPSENSRSEYFDAIIKYIETSPADFPDPMNRKPRHLVKLLPAPSEAPKDPPPLSKAELKAQKKKDRLLLNQLKIRIQPVMDQIKNKYRKFRLAVIEEKDIRYLFEEEDPAMVTSDLPREQAPNVNRPFEKAVDEHGEPGLKETATGRFFYNLDLATIEKRLSNGYYKRPRDFLADVKKLTKDAKTVGDEERRLKANELQANVEVDMDNIEQENPAAAAELENIFHRELQREKEMIEKAKAKAAQEGRRLEAVVSNVPHNDLTISTDASTGPINLGQPLTNGSVRRPLTSSMPSTLTNGLSNRISDLSDLHGHLQSNGTSVPSVGNAVQTSLSEERTSFDKGTQASSSYGPSAQVLPPGSYPRPPQTLEERKPLPASHPSSLSQRHVVTPMMAGSQPIDYINDASTTTSSDRKHTGSSGERDTQSSKGGGPDLSIFMQHEGEPNSQTSNQADTVAASQASQSSPQSASNPSAPSSSESQGQISYQPASQPERPGVPPFSQPREHSRSSISALLNDEPPPPRSQPPTSDLPHPPLTIDRGASAELKETLVRATERWSVEQLEQVYSAMMNRVWETRGDWDRRRVVESVKRGFEEEVEDMGGFQGIVAENMDVDEPYHETR